MAIKIILEGEQIIGIRCCVSFGITTTKTWEGVGAVRLEPQSSVLDALFIIFLYSTVALDVSLVGLFFSFLVIIILLSALNFFVFYSYYQWSFYLYEMPTTESKANIILSL